MVPTHRISLFRGEFQTANDDTADSRLPIALNVPASLVEQSALVMSPETGRSYDVETVAGLVGGRVDVRKGDRLLDQATGSVYTVDSVVHQSGILAGGDIRLRLRLLQ
jgi:hypothetical protein